VSAKLEREKRSIKANNIFFIQTPKVKDVKKANLK
jgi:hypothetical protein